jgi:hypothetical protein
MSTTIPAVESTAMKHTHRMAEMSAHGTTTLKGPILSAKMLGMIPNANKSVCVKNLCAELLTSKSRCAVHDSQKVECQVFCCDLFLESIHLTVEEGHVQTHEAAEEACHL